jgi:hypothetical protein
LQPLRVAKIKNEHHKNKNKLEYGVSKKRSEEGNKEKNKRRSMRLSEIVHLRLTEFICLRRLSSLSSECFIYHSKALQMAIHPKTHRKQKPIGALNSARIGERAKPTKISKLFLENW